MLINRLSSHKRSEHINRVVEWHELAALTRSFTYCSFACLIAEACDCGKAGADDELLDDEAAPDEDEEEELVAALPLEDEAAGDAEGSTSLTSAMGCQRSVQWVAQPWDKHRDAWQSCCV